MNASQFNKLADDTRTVVARCEGLRIELDAKYGCGRRAHWSSKDRTNYDKLRNRADKLQQKLFDAIGKLSPRDWRYGIPCSWIVENANWDIVTTREAIPVPPPALFTNPIVCEDFAKALPPLPTMKPGYAYASARRDPREPETVMVADSDCSNANWVRTQDIDGLTYQVFKIGRRFYFQRPC